MLGYFCFQVFHRTNVTSRCRPFLLDVYQGLPAQSSGAIEYIAHHRTIFVWLVSEPELQSIASLPSLQGR